MTPATDERDRVPERVRESTETASNEPIVAPDAVDDRSSAVRPSAKPEPLLSGRLDVLLGGVPLPAKAALLGGVAGGLFVDIVLSSTGTGPPYVGIGLGVALGIVGAVVVSLRSRRESRRVRR